MHKKFLSASEMETGKKYLQADILWDEIVSIVSVGVRRVYDITVPDTHNFLANDIVVHNSFWLQDMAWRAYEQGRRVAFFEAGDLSKGQVLDRFIVRAAGRPIYGDPVHDFNIPESIEAPQNKNGTARVETRRVRFKKDMSEEMSVEALSKITSDGGFRLSVHPNSTLSVSGIESQLEQWHRDDFFPDCIFCDYADIMAPVDKRPDTRDQINETWKALRGLSQKHNCLVVTATQARRTAYSTWLMGRDDVADDKRKLAHVTGMIGINRTSHEIEAGVWRLNWVVVRGLPISAERCVYTSGCLDVGNPAIVSTF